MQTKIKNNYQLLSFEKDNVQILKKLLPQKKIYKIKQNLKKNLLSDLKSVDKGLNNKNFKIKKKKINFKNLRLKEKRILSGMFGLETRLNQSILKLITTKQFINKLNKIIKKKISKLHMPPMIRHSIPNNNFAQVPAHTDAIYNKHMKNFVTVWIPLVKIDQKCQGLRFYIKKKKKIFKNKIKKTEKSHFWKKPISTDNYYSVDINKLNIGDVIVFNNKIIHESLKNKSSKIKFSIDARYIFEKAQTKKSYMDIKSKKIVIR